MDADQIEILGTLRNKIKKIMTALVEEQDKSEKLKNEVGLLKLKYDQQVKEFEDLEQKYNNLKLAKALNENNEEGHDARIKVNRIVREIDRCIALLNR